MERQKSSFLVHSVACTGTEIHLAACPLEFRKPNATLSCEGGMAAVVSCMPGPLFMQNSGLKKKLKTSVSPTGARRLRTDALINASELVPDIAASLSAL